MHYLKDPDCDLLEYMPMPDFSTGGEIIYRREEMEKIIETGLGSFQIRSRWRWIPEERIIEVYEIPYTTKTDVIIERIVKLSTEPPIGRTGRAACEDGQGAPDRPAVEKVGLRYRTSPSG